jgi:hypothetical protein
MEGKARLCELFHKFNSKKMEESERISNALSSGKLRLGSQKTRATMPVFPLQNRPRISKDWGFDTSFKGICKKCLYCFRIKDNSRENNKPHFAMSEDGGRIEFVQISNNAYGILVSGVGSMPKSKLDNKDSDISKDGNQMVIDYLIETGAGDLVI